MIIKVKKHWSFVKLYEYGDVHIMILHNNFIKMEFKGNLVNMIKRTVCHEITLNLT